MPQNSEAEQEASPSFFVAREKTLPLPTFVCEKSDSKPESTLLSFKYQKESHSLIVVSRCQDGVLTMDGLLPTGIALFSLTWDGKTVDAKVKLPVPNAPDPKQILGDYLLAHLPLSFWEALLPQGYTMKDVSSTERTLSGPQGLLETIRYSVDSGKRVPRNVEQHHFGYTITLAPVEGIENTH